MIEIVRLVGQTLATKITIPQGIDIEGHLVQVPGTVEGRIRAGGGDDLALGREDILFLSSTRLG